MGGSTRLVFRLVVRAEEKEGGKVYLVQRVYV